LLLGPDILGKLFHWSAGVGVLLLTSAVGQRLGGRSVGLVSAFLVAVLPLFSFLSTTCYVDLFVALWALAAVLCLTMSGENGQPSSAVIAGSIFLGMVLGAKYVAWGTVVAPVLIALVLFWVPRQGAFRAILRTATVAVCSLLVAGPWLLYNILWTGNPTYPLLAGIFGRHIPPCAAAEAFFRLHSPPPETLTLTGYPPYLLMRLRELVSEAELIFFSGFLAALLYLCRGRSHERRFLGLIVILSSLVFFIATDNHDGRFFFPALSLCAVLTGLLLSDLVGYATEAGTHRSLVAGGYLLAAGLFLFWIPQRVNQIRVFDQKIIPSVSRYGREAVLRERFPGFDLVTWANENLPTDALVLGMGYPLQRRYISKNKYGYIPWLTDGPSLSDPDRLADVLRQAGVTHIATPWPILAADIDLSILLPSHLTEVNRADTKILYALD
jgi:4-amino-4-deoxy-L-arabinose transferase-like glycosyltransferase